MSIYTRLHETGTMDDMLSCPYNPSHVMGANRFQAHLLKCRKQHPEKAELMGICPYNQIHHVYLVDMEKHLAVCPQYHHFQRSVIPLLRARKEREDEELKKNGGTKGDAEADGAGALTTERSNSPPPPPTAEDLKYLNEWM